MTAAHAVAVAVGLVLAGCGGDDGAAMPPPIPAGGTKPAGPTSPGGPGAKTQPLSEKMHIEDRVSCAIPDKPTDPKDGGCDPKAPSCAEHLYCLQLTQGYFCEPCPERDGIRHVFKDRDFAMEQNRDPFQSPLFSIFPPPGPPRSGPKCLRKDQMVATSYSYAELKLVGIVAQGTQRKVLMIRGPLGYIIKRGDCVGKEKAVVKDIGTGYVTFLIDPDTSAANSRGPEEFSVQLNPKQLVVNYPEVPTPNPPVVPPQAGAGSAGSSGAVARPALAPPVTPNKP